MPPTARKASVPAIKKYITVEFIADGLTAWGKVWVTGEQVTIEVGGRSWIETCNRKGEGSWIELDPEGQNKRWRKQYFKTIANPDDLSTVKEPRPSRNR